MNTLLIMGCFSSKIMNETSEKEFSKELSSISPPNTPSAAVRVAATLKASVAVQPGPRMTITTPRPKKLNNIFSSYRRARISILGDSP